MPDRLVIDASVAAKWFLRDASEADTDLADHLLRRFLAGDLELFAPEIFPHEVTGFLSKACRRTRISRTKAADAIRDLFAMPITVTRTDATEQVETLDMSVDFSKKNYDMAYLRLAIRLDCRLCTADEKIMKANPAGFPANRVLLLSSLR
jgi:predicted nucleic acid-binding protein